MKEKDGVVNCPEQQLILYVEKEDGTFGPMQTGSYITAHFLNDYFLKRRNLEESLKKEIIQKKISPIKYFMILEDLTLSELASRMKLRKRKVKRHLNPSCFHLITLEQMNQYATVFNVTVEEINQLALL
jgi:hypothetical protein